MRNRDREYFAEWLTRTLAERDIAGGEAARALGVSDSVISRWRNGKATPGLESVMALADFLEVDWTALAVTAGLMDEERAGVAKLALPEDSKRHGLILDQINNIRGLTSEEKAQLMSKYEQMMQQEA